MIKKTIEELHLDLINNKVTPKELIEHSLKLAHKYQEDYNSYVTILENVKETKVTDNLLSGIPYSVKDLFSTKDILTTGSSNALKNYIPFFDATAVLRLNEIGAINIGKTVCDEFGLGGTGTTGHTGIVKNPWNKFHIAGGSSAGSATCVALGITPYALGTDTGDSIRKPAAFCGIVGFKPTYGLVSRYGVLPFASSLDHVGVFTRNVKDAAIVIDQIKGSDEKDMTVIESPDLTPLMDGKVKGKKLFYLKELCNKDQYPKMNSSLEKTLETFKKTLDKIKNLGIEISEESIDKKLLEAIYPTYFCISCAEATSNLSMYTGIIYGPRGEGKSVNELMIDYRTKSFSPLIKRRLVIGSYVLQKENQERFYLNACRVRRLIVQKMNELFNKYDGLILPASGGEAPLIERENEILTNEEIILEDHLAISNFGGFPSITIPNGFINGLPIGINITGKVLDDANILNIASAIENTMDYRNQIARGDLNE